MAGEEILKLDEIIRTDLETMFWPTYRLTKYDQGERDSLVYLRWYLRPRRCRYTGALGYGHLLGWSCVLRREEPVGVATREVEWIRMTWGPPS